MYRPNQVIKSSYFFIYKTHSLLICFLYFENRIGGCYELKSDIETRMEKGMKEQDIYWDLGSIKWGFEKKNLNPSKSNWKAAAFRPLSPFPSSWLLQFEKGFPASFCFPFSLTLKRLHSHAYLQCLERFPFSCRFLSLAHSDPCFALLGFIPRVLLASVRSRKVPSWSRWIYTQSFFIRKRGYKTKKKRRRSTTLSSPGMKNILSGLPLKHF